MRGLYIALDANLNRAVEGLRVCEDIFRFTFKNGISSRFKKVRHDISRVIDPDFRKDMVASRDTGSDEQKYVNTITENSREGILDVFTANIRRAIESSRVLEEMGKILNPEYGAAFQNVRFSLYDLEQLGQALIGKTGLLERFSNSIYCIIDSAFVSEDKIIDTCRVLIDGGAQIIQLRMKEASSGDYLKYCCDLSLICREHDVLFVVNDRPDIAKISRARGLHLGQDDIPVDAARKICGDEMVIGISTHEQKEFDAALDSSADYIAMGPVFDTSSKTDKTISGVGLDFLKYGCERSTKPMVAIGGINSNNIKAVFDNGADSVAVISELYKSGDPAQSLEKLLTLVKK